ncbi:hypothetical protein [Mycolicibacterium holsaticum]|uniref:Uncharacterized protein n=1 Tax=Mycolicibacterium holsaticum TaxID=152142 RepID=A0A1E3S4T1_9MYCO|nr:hypothetical protein [Mycolicibacterium holsaticum]ODQ96607.1 hypothetical protein BHQ17_00080 [Mycolicibacterium holsaticum]
MKHPVEGWWIHPGTGLDSRNFRGHRLPGRVFEHPAYTEDTFVLDASREPLTDAQLTLIFTTRHKTQSPRILWDAWWRGRITDDQLTRWLYYVCAGQSSPLDVFEEYKWRTMFRHVGFTFDGQPAEPPTITATLYRGSPFKYRRRWSWTPDLSTALKYAQSARRLPGVVWAADVPCERMLAMITECREVIVDTARLPIRKFAEVVHTDAGPVVKYVDEPRPEDFSTFDDYVAWRVRSERVL